MNDDQRNHVPLDTQSPETPAVSEDRGDPRFSVREVEKTKTPEGADGDDWCRYVIDAPGSTITGLRRGSRDEVHDFARSYAEQLRVRTDPRTPAGYAGTRRSK